MRIVTQPSALSDAGIYLADARGYFREAGIQIDRVGMNAVEGTTALIGGQVEIAAFPPTTGLLNATGRGVALKVVADKGEEGNGFAYQSVVVRRDLYESGAVQRIADLRGRRLALNLNGSPLEASIAAGLRQSGLTLADVDIQEGLGFPEQMQALGNGALDVAVLLEPLVTQALNNHTGTILSPVWSSSRTSRWRLSCMAASCWTGIRTSAGAGWWLTSVASGPTTTRFGRASPRYTQKPSGCWPPLRVLPPS